MPIPMKNVDKKLMLQFLKLAGERLKGDWTVIGGTVLPLLGLDDRVTVDIDIVGPRSAGQSETLQLMEIAETLGLAVESINQAGAFFLRKIPDWKESLVLVHEGKGARLFRPNTTLFLELKVGRLDDVDLQDCLNTIRLSGKSVEAIDRQRIRRVLEREMKGAMPERRYRLEALRARLED